MANGSMVGRDDEHGVGALLLQEEGRAEIVAAPVEADVDLQITTARRYPRSVTTFLENAITMATLDQETAAGCFYALPRSGKTITGPTIRLAEIVLSAWGNIRTKARVVDVGVSDLTAEGVCWDLEKNTAVSVQVKRRIRDSKGKRYNDDMIVVTGNAACAIALRNAVFKVVPMAYTKTVLDKARRVAAGKEVDLSARRKEMIAHFKKLGADEARVLAAIERPSLADVTIDDVATLIGVANAIRDHETTVAEAFPPLEKPGTKTSAADLAAKPTKETSASSATSPGELASLDQLDAIEDLRDRHGKAFVAEMKALGKTAPKDLTADEARALIDKLKGSEGELFGTAKETSAYG